MTLAELLATVRRVEVQTNRLVNDIAPAKAHGWQTGHFPPQETGRHAPNTRRLQDFKEGQKEVVTLPAAGDTRETW